MTNLELQALIVALNSAQALTADQRKIIFDALNKVEKNGRGLLVRMMEAIFGVSWRSSLFAVLSYVAAMAAAIQQWVVDIGVPTKVSISIAVTLKLIGSLMTGDSKVANSNTAAIASKP
jgi:hypothetical protein